MEAGRRLHADLAASARRLLERCLTKLAREALTATGTTRLCIADGVGLNCSANGRLAGLCGMEELFVQPAVGEAGCAIRRGARGRPAPAATSPSPSPAMTTATFGPACTR